MLENGPILVALDGSELAEGALPYAAALGEALHERIVVVTAWEGTADDLAATFPAMALEIEAKAGSYYTEYLDGIRARLGDTLQVETQVVSGDAVEQILAAARDVAARMIVLATHGRSGLSRWIYGSTAARLLRESPVPVLAVGPRALERSPGDVALRHIMVPLDGSSLAEAALPVARTLAVALGARITLARAVPWAVQAYPYGLPQSYIPQFDGEMEKGASDYLASQASTLTGVQADAFVIRGAAAESLIDVAEEQSVDLVVMTTHARSGIARMALGSTADRMLQGPAPVLLLRPNDA